MLSHISDIYKRNLQGVLPCVFEKLFYTKRIPHIPRISPFCEFFRVFAMIFIWKDFSTLFTFMGFLYSVTPFMYLKKNGIKECFLSFLTFIR